MLTLGTFLLTGLGWGMLHAFDPDHVAAVAGVSANGKNPKQQLWRFALRWSLGHGSVIGLIAIAVLLFGMAIPVSFSSYAEHSIALLLIVLGTVALISQRYQTRDGSDVSAHRSAIFIGLVHGVAGSAPLLALIPLAHAQHPLIGILYVVFFSTGVLLAMTSLSGLLMYSMRWCSRVSVKFQRTVRVLFALFSMGVGVFLLL